MKDAQGDNMNKTDIPIWQTPLVEEIELKFDKEMGTACFGSENNPYPNDQICGYDEGAAHSCWNKGGN